MELIFEIGNKGRRPSILPECDVPETGLPESMLRKMGLHLPELSENEINRHYTKLADRAHGVNNSFKSIMFILISFGCTIGGAAGTLSVLSAVLLVLPFWYLWRFIEQLVVESKSCR